MRPTLHALCGLLLTVPTAAPVPAPPTRLTPALVVGRWDAHEGSWHGEMVFDPDGVYSWSIGDTGAGAWGRWWVTDRGELRLSEHRGPDCTAEWVYARFDLRDVPRTIRARGLRLTDPTGTDVPVLMTRVPGG